MRLLLCTLLVLASQPLWANSALTGKDIMQLVYEHQQQFPYVYEEQNMIMVDRHGHRDTRKMRRYSRLDGESAGRYMLVMDAPQDVRGVALMAARHGDAGMHSQLYLPALGPQLINSINASQQGNFLGTDFSVSDLMPEPFSLYSYERLPDQKIDKTPYYVIELTPRTGKDRRPVKRHFIRQDILYIVRTDNLDHLGRVSKRQTHFDLKQLGPALWRANMILMQDFKHQHQSLIKISRRVFSQDYVPSSLFSLQWLQQNQQYQAEPQPPEDDPLLGEQLNAMLEQVQ